jgi:hypothetical protein
MRRVVFTYLMFETAKGSTAEGIRTFVGTVGDLVLGGNDGFRGHMGGG